MRTTRRTFVRASLATAAAALLPIALRAQEGAPARRPIPSTGETIPIVGLGTWITFNVGGDAALRDECAAVMAAFFAAGATRRAAAEAGLDVVTSREADDLLRDAETFLALVDTTVGVPHQIALPRVS